MTAAERYSVTASYGSAVSSPRQVSVVLHEDTDWSMKSSESSDGIIGNRWGNDLTIPAAPTPTTTYTVTFHRNYTSSDTTTKSQTFTVTVTTSGVPAALARSRERRASEITNAPVEVVTRIVAGE